MSLRDWILPREPDVLAVLREHAGVVAEGLEAFARWAATGDDDDGQLVRDLEHEADARRRALGDLLYEALATPIDRETLFVIGERLDAALNRAKNLVRETQVAGWRPDDDVRTMAEHLASSARHVEAGITALGEDDETARREVYGAIRCVRSVEHHYRESVARAQVEADVRAFVIRLELYRQCLGVAAALEETARRLSYAVLKGM